MLLVKLLLSYSTVILILNFLLPGPFVVIALVSYNALLLLGYIAHCKWAVNIKEDIENQFCKNSNIPSKPRTIKNYLKKFRQKCLLIFYSLTQKLLFLCNSRNKTANYFVKNDTFLFEKKSRIFRNPMQAEEKAAARCWYLRRQPPRMEPPRRRGAAATHALITHTLTHESTIHPPSSSLAVSVCRARGLRPLFMRLSSRPPLF